MTVWYAPRWPKTSIHGRRLALSGDNNSGLLLVQGEVDGFSFAAAKGGSSNICLVTIQALNHEGGLMADALGGNQPYLVWLSDAATGQGLTATTPSGGLAAGATGHILGVVTASKALIVQPTSGVFILSITDTAKTGFYVCAAPFAKQLTSVSAQLVSGNYD